MFSTYKAISLSYKNASVAIRERLALDEPATRELLKKLASRAGITDVLVVSTCNRTEIYYCSEEDQMARYNGKLSSREIELLDKITKNLTQKFLKLPVLQLKAACKRGEAEMMLGVLNEVFSLNTAFQTKAPTGVKKVSSSNQQIVAPSTTN